MIGLWLRPKYVAEMLVLGMDTDEFQTRFSTATLNGQKVNVLYYLFTSSSSLNLTIENSVEMRQLPWEICLYALSLKLSAFVYESKKFFLPIS